MSGANARDGRRRRMLQDASRETSAHPAASPDGASDSSGQASSEGRRYAFVDGSLGGALARRHFPNHLLLPLGLGLGGVATVAGVVALHVYREGINAATGGNLASLITLTSPTSLASWLATSLTLLVAVLAAAVFAVRRRRVDDYKGRHKLWRGATLAAGVLSLAAATNFHSAVGQTLASATGVRLMRGGAEWWLAGAALLFGWVGIRVLLDIKESRIALTSYILAGIAGLVSLIANLVGLPVSEAANPLVAVAAQLSCYVLLATTLTTYMRFLRHDVAAGVATKPQKTQTTKSKSIKLAKQTRTKAAETPEPIAEENTTKSRRASAKKQQQDEPAVSKWTDGSDGGEEHYDDEIAPRKLSKSERKRLRKLKADRRAA